MIVDDFNTTLQFLKKKNKILFLTTSSRWSESTDIPKSTEIAILLSQKLSDKDVTIINVTKLNIYPCEGNVSDSNGNNCGVLKAILKDKEKNPTGNHRCWASLNNEDDELWKVTKELFESDVVIFFTSIRWGKPNSIYSKLLERLTFIENRFTSLKEKNVLESKETGIIVTGHNFNGHNAIELEKNNLSYFGFKVEDKLCWNHQWTDNSDDETSLGYKKDSTDFKDIIDILKKEKVIKFSDRDKLK